MKEEINNIIARISLFTIAAVILFGVFPYTCTRPEETHRVLRQSGYSEVEITGWRPFSGSGEAFSTGFEAKSPNGENVSGAVSSGIFKGATIRLD